VDGQTNNKDQTRQIDYIQNRMDTVEDKVRLLEGLTVAVTRSAQSTDLQAVQIKELIKEYSDMRKELNERDEKTRQYIHELSTSHSNHHVVLFGPQGSHKMGVVSDVSTLMATHNQSIDVVSNVNTLMAAHNQSIGGWKVAIAALTLGASIQTLLAWILHNFVTLHP
jgi:hypothetical protein